MTTNALAPRLAVNPAFSRSPRSRDSLRGGRGEPGRFSQAHEGVAYGCCVPALTRFTYPHCPGPPRLTLTPASRGQSFCFLALSGIDRPRSRATCKMDG